MEAFLTMLDMMEKISPKKELFFVRTTHAPENFRAKVLENCLNDLKAAHPNYEYVGISQEWESDPGVIPKLHNTEFHFKLK